MAMEGWENPRNELSDLIFAKLHRNHMYVPGQQKDLAPLPSSPLSTECLLCPSSPFSLITQNKATVWLSPEAFHSKPRLLTVCTIPFPKKAAAFSPGLCRTQSLPIANFSAPREPARARTTFLETSHQLLFLFQAGHSPWSKAGS